MARWAVGTVLFGSIVLLKVLVPYADFSGQVSTLQSELAEVRNDLASIEVEREALEKIGGRLETVRGTIERQPWTAEKDRLIRALREVSNAHTTLSRASPAQVLEAFRASLRAPEAPIGQQIAPQSRQPHPLARVPASRPSVSWFANPAGQRV